MLHAVGQTVLGLIREIDVAARYGGEEFAMLLPQTDREGAANLAERLRSAIAERDIQFAGETIDGVTASFGVAAGPDDGATQLDLIAIADAALYQAKQGGKNDVGGVRLEFVESPPGRRLRSARRLILASLPAPPASQRRHPGTTSWYTLSAFLLHSLRPGGRRCPQAVRCSHQ